MACMRAAYSAAWRPGSPLAAGKAPAKRCRLAWPRMVVNPLWPMTSWIASITRRTRALGSARPASDMPHSRQTVLIHWVAQAVIHKSQAAVNAERGGVGVLGVDGQLANAAPVVVSDRRPPE